MAVKGLKIEDPSSTSSAPLPDIDLNPVQAGRVIGFRRCCLLRCGQNPDATSSPATSSGSGLPPPSATGSGTVSGSGTSGRTKLAAVIDPALPGDLVPMEDAAIQKLFDDYHIREECFPSQENEPSHDQLSGLNQVALSGATPYVDFSVFGPHGIRALRKLVYATYFLSTVSGEWQRKELPGPPDFEAWWKSFRVYKTAMVLLALCSSERLEAYGELIRDLSSKFPWHLVYQADVRMRSDNYILN